LSTDKNGQEHIIIALKEKGATQPCPRCRNLEFEAVGETWIPLVLDQVNAFGNPSAQVPLTLISCKLCGYIASHSKGVLGLVR
jgi:predicted nucleic-acid-binding Zn-ribbon protein